MPVVPSSAPSASTIIVYESEPLTKPSMATPYLSFLSFFSSLFLLDFFRPFFNLPPPLLEESLRIYKRFAVSNLVLALSSDARALPRPLISSMDLASGD